MNRGSVYLVGVAGGTASGKTSTCREIQMKLRADGMTAPITIIFMDSFYIKRQDDEDPNTVNYDHPSRFDFPLLLKVLTILKRGGTATVPHYDFVTHQRDEAQSIVVRGDGCIIVEGILVLYKEAIRQLFDIKLYVETAPDIRLIRRLRRDIAERGRTMESVLVQCETTVIPAHDQFVEPTKKYADLIVPRGRANTTAIDVMVIQITNRRVTFPPLPVNYD